MSFGGGENTSGGPTGPGGAGDGLGSNYNGSDNYSGIDSALNDFFGGLDRLSAASTSDLEGLFKTKLDPLMSSRYGTLANFTTKAGSYALSGLLNMVMPGMGTLASVSGLSKKAANAMRDSMVANEISQALGLGGNYDTVADAVGAAYSAGKSEQEIAQAYNNVSERRGGVMGLWDDITGKSSASTATSAANTAASYQQQAIDYLKQMGAIPLSAQKGLAGIYGLPGGTGTQAQAISAAKASPLYSSIMGTREDGEEAIMRNAAMTGGLRSGNIQSALYDYNTQLSKDALTQAYGQQLMGLTGLAGMGTYAGDIATGLGAMGNTYATGQMLAEMANQQGTKNLLDIGGSVVQGLGGIGGIAKGIGGMWDAGKAGYEASGVLGAIGGAIGSLF